MPDRVGFDAFHSERDELDDVHEKFWGEIHKATPFLRYASSFLEGKLADISKKEDFDDLMADDYYARRYARLQELASDLRVVYGDINRMYR